jgi:hypothetical protein
MALQVLLRASAIANSSSLRKIKSLEHIFKKWNRIDYAILDPDPVAMKWVTGGINKPDF